MTLKMLIKALKDEYYTGVNHPEINIQGYLCDRCGTQPLTEREYINNSMVNGLKYCDECRNFITLKKWKCIYCMASGSIRNERIVPKECECGGLVVWLKT